IDARPLADQHHLAFDAAQDAAVVDADQNGGAGSEDRDRSAPGRTGRRGTAGRDRSQEFTAPHRRLGGRGPASGYLADRRGRPRRRPDGADGKVWGAGGGYRPIGGGAAGSTRV